MLKEAAPGILGSFILWYIHLFIQQICMEKLLCARYCSRCWVYGDEQNPCPLGAPILVSGGNEQVNDK